MMLREEIIYHKHTGMVRVAYPQSTPRIRLRIKNDPSKMRLIK